MKKFALLLLLAGLLPACRPFDSLEKNPNLPAQVPPALVLRGVLMDLHEGAWNKEQRWNQYYTINYNYYGNNEYDWTAAPLRYTTLKNVLKMEEEARRLLGDKNPYASLGKFFRAYFYVWMTQRVGDLPMAEALGGTENRTPRFDTQKDIYLQSLQWLDEANTELGAFAAAGDRGLQGDFYFNNDLRKWQQVVNAFQLRVLMSLSQKENDPDLKIKQRFAALVASPATSPLLGSAADNLQFVYNSVYNKYPLNPDNLGFDATRQQLSATPIELLKRYRDPRLFVVAEPAEALLAKGAQPTDFAAYQGGSVGESMGELAARALRGEYSYINRNRYYRGYTAEPTVILGYAEQQFLLAEAAWRGWIAAPAAGFYHEGIRTSFAFFGLKDGDNPVALEVRRDGTTRQQAFTVPLQIEAYLARPEVQLGTGRQALEQIINQKYLAMFMHTGLQAYFDWRRTGLPSTFVTSGPGLGNSGSIPRRWLYPASERVYNEANYRQALKRQFGDEKRDNINDDLWALRP